MKLPHNPSLIYLMTGLLTCATVMTARADYPSTVLADGPVAYWRFTDAPVMAPLPLVTTNQGSVGTAGDGTAAGAFTRGVPAAMAGTTATRFTSGYISVPYDAGLNPAGPFTAEWWTKPAGGSSCPFNSVDFAGSPRKGWLFYQDSIVAGQWTFRVYKTGGANVQISGGTVSTNWHHVAGVYDGSNISLYVDGTLVAGPTPLGDTYTPVTGSVPLRMGMRSDNSFAYSGDMEDAAVYSSALDATTIQAHYAAATTNAAGYAAQILAAAPAGYWRLNEPDTTLAAVNSGTAGASLKGAYGYAGTYYASSGPQPPTEAGFDTTNVAVNLTNNPVTAPALMLNTNTVTFEAWVNPRSINNNFEGILFARSGGANWGIQLNGSGQLTYGWNGDGWDYNSGLTPPLNQWSYVAVVIKPDRCIVGLYDGTTWSSATQMRANAVSLISAPTFIGYDGYGSRHFQGAIDEAAAYGKSLTVGQLRTHALAGFDVTNAPLLVYDPPVAAPGTIYVTQPFTVTTEAYGWPAPAYQWRLNGTNITSGTNTVYAKASSTLADSGAYDVIVSNAGGAVTSSVVAVSINASVAATVAQGPADRQIYAGGRAALKVVAGGTAPFTYQWKHAGTNVPGGTNATLVIKNVSAPAAGVYTVAVSNMVGGAVSIPATLIIRTPSSAYETALVAAGPQEYWRLDETTGANAADYMSSYDGVNTGTVTVGQVGPQPAAQAGFEAANSTFAYANPSRTETGLPLLDNLTNFTMCCWINTPSVASLNALMSQEQNIRLGFYNGNLMFQVVVPNNVNIQVPAGQVADGQWHFVACTGTSSNIALYVDGVLKANTAVNAAAGYTTGTTFNIGGSLWGTTGNDYSGNLDEAAIFHRDLTASEIAMLYSIGIYGTATPPQIVQQPTAATVYAGGTVNFSVLAAGSQPLNYQWNSNGVPLAGATGTSLLVTNVQGSHNGTLYSVTVTNSAGLTNSDTALLTIRTPNAGYETAAAAAGPLAYWRMNEEVGSTTAYDFAGGYNATIRADVQLGYMGPQPGDGFTWMEGTNTAGLFTRNAANSSVVVPPMNYSSNGLTVTVWMNPDAAQNDWAGLVFCRGGGSTFGLNYGGAGGGGGSSAGNLTYTTAGAADGYPWLSGIMPPANQWSFVALVVQPTGAMIHMFNTNGQSAATNVIAQPNVSFVANTHIGTDPYSLGGRAYNGYLDEVAIYPYAMTPTQLQELYNGAIAPSTPPQLTIQPSGGTVVLTWQGLLLEADEVTGPWTTNSAAVSPMTNSASGARKFYRALAP